MIRYILIVLFILPRKIIGLVLFYIALPFSKYLNNRVFNYALQHNIHLPRLFERPISKLDHFLVDRKMVKGYKIAPYHGTNGGYILYKRVSKLEYRLALCLWIWLDNDSNYFTTDYGFMKKLVAGEHFSWLPVFLKNQVAREVKQLEATGQYGNSFDLGDKRKFEFYWLSSTLWLIRNTAYNAKYLLHEIAEDNPRNFYYKFPKLGWHFGYIPYSNPTHKGRLVYFSEYYDKIKI